MHSASSSSSSSTSTTPAPSNSLLPTRASYLHLLTHLPLPLELVEKILDMAEYWPLAVDSHDELPREARPRNIRQSSTLIHSVRVPVSNVRKVRFTVTSKDQGWSSADRELQGTYEGSWTWFEAEMAETDEAIGAARENDMDRERIITNRHAGRSYEEQVHNWRRIPKMGEYVQLWACAMFPGWENKVWETKIEVYYAPEE